MRKKTANKYFKIIFGFYRLHVKKIHWLHGVIVWFYFLLFPVGSQIYWILNRFYKKQYYRLVSQSFFFAEEKGVESTILFAQNTTINAPAVYPSKYQDKLEFGGKVKIFPDIKIVTILDVEVVGASNIIFSCGKAITHDLYDVHRDTTSEEMHRRYIISPTFEFIARNGARGPKKTFRKAACFTDACSANYAHWLTEVLPRIYLFSELGLSSDIKLIIDRGLHPNLIESLHVITGDISNIFKLGRNRVVKVEELSLITCAGYVPFGRRNKKMQGHSHGNFSSDSLKGMVSKIRQNIGVENNQGWRKLYIKRNSGTRIVINADEIERTLIALGFEVVEPEKLTFSQQVKLFSEAEMVVGSTGAAMVNLIFCPSGTPIFIMISYFSGTSYGYWQNIANAVDNRIIYIIGSISNHFSNIHSDFYINSMDIVSAINSEF